MAQPRKIVLIHRRAPGDTCVLTGLVRDIALAHPGRFEIDVQTSAMDLWRHNPYLTPLVGKPNVEYVKINYGRGLRDQNYEPVHFLPYFHRDFERQCKTAVPLLRPYPDLHLSDEERNVRPITGRYWIVISGGKSDFTAKVWDVRKMQTVADHLREMGLGVVQIGSTDKGHWHPPIDGALNVVGQTNLRDMMRLIHHADGVICGVTCAMHMAAALQRPCVVLGGGREAWWWEAYVRENKGLAPVASQLAVPHQFLHTIGLLDCCRFHGCWKNKVVKISEDNSLCKMPIVYPGQAVPKCLDMIGVDHVLGAVMKYYEDKTLPPISEQPTQPVMQHAAPATPPAPPSRKAILGLFDDPPPEPVAPPAATPAAPPAEPPAAPQRGGTPLPHNRHKATLSIPRNVLAQIAAGAKLEGRVNGRPAKMNVAPASPINLDDSVFDHEYVGGKFTICVLCYGDERYVDLHKRCLNSIIATVPKERMDLRVGSNALNDQSCLFINSLVGQGVITKHYQHHDNHLKYPVMREMFFDPDHPITTKWVVWFDDDSIADRTPNWLRLLSQAIILHHKRDNAHMFGAPFINTPSPSVWQALSSRPWYKNRPRRMHNGKPSPNGNKIVFCTGGFWALTHEAIVACDIPDLGTGLSHNGGDIQIGEQLYQGGFGMKSFNTQKQHVFTSSVPRRGVTTPFPGGERGVPKLTQVP